MDSRLRGNVYQKHLSQNNSAMKPVFTFTEIRDIESKIISAENFPSIVLMENAGKNSFDILCGVYGDLDEYEIYILTGKGNNAGDGYTLARHLMIHGFEFKIVQIDSPTSLKGDALINYDALVKCGFDFKLAMPFDDFVKRTKTLHKRSNVIVIDAVLGTGISGTLNDKYSDVIQYLNQLKNRVKNLRVASLDIPSGMMSGKQVNPMVKADITITMGSLKTELLFNEGRENSGEVYIAPIGITNELIEKYDSYNRRIVELSDVKAVFPKRRKTSYKYSNGKTLVIGGSKGLSGAVIMSSLSAVKSGAGGVAAAIPLSAAVYLGKKLFEVMKVELGENEEGGIRGDSFDKIKKRMEWADAVLLGPGISTSEDTKNFVFDVITNCNKDIVIDADALNFIAADTDILKRRKFNNKVILTPHIGEFCRLSGLNTEQLIYGRFEQVRRFTSEFKVNVVLKSETTISCVESGIIYINSTGNQSLATAGSGDVLSGIITSMLAQTGDVKTAMICGNYLHGLCADLYFDKNKNKQTASPQDIIKLIPKALTEILN